MALGRFRRTEDVYDINMRIVRRSRKDVNLWQKTIDKGMRYLRWLIDILPMSMLRRGMVIGFFLLAYGAVCIIQVSWHMSM